MAKLKRCIELIDEGVQRVRESVIDLPSREATLARMLLLSGDGVRHSLEQSLKPNRLNDSEFQTLMILYSSPDGFSTPSELCDYTSQGATNMTRITHTLVKRGLITRQPSHEDRRRVQLQITASGRRLVRKMLPPLFPNLALMFSGFSDNDKRTLDRLLRRLAGNLDQRDTPTS
ncbi:MAG: MarR family transcriptional regulator [Dyella sp.]